MKPHLIIGASGQVGEYLLQAVTAAGFQTAGTYYTHPVDGLQKMDLRAPSEVFSVVKHIRPAVIYLPASLTNVDYVEAHPEEGFEINVTGVQHVVRAANQSDSQLVYFSSDYIFDGKTGHYQEDDAPNPICVYGLQKLIAETYIALHARRFLILRTTGVYGWERQGKNFIYRLIKNLTEDQTLRVPVDQIGTPTYAPDLARAAVELALANKQGVYHVAGTEEANRYEFAVYAAGMFGLDSARIVAVPTSRLGQTAPRPLHGGLNVARAAGQLSFKLSGFRTGLQAMLQTFRSIYELP
jgi:dTDP-4-dehydrorhamnose reductase